MNKESQDAVLEAKIKGFIIGMLEGKTLKSRYKDPLNLNWKVSYAQELLESTIQTIQRGVADGFEYHLFSPKQKVWQWIGLDEDGKYWLTPNKWPTDPWVGRMVKAEPYLPSEEEREEQEAE